MENLGFLCLLVVIIGHNSATTKGAEPPTLYEYYTEGGIKSGLKGNSETFSLNNKPFTILGGSLHYFRAVPGHWRDRLLKMRAVGLNAVELYVPWNLHEQRPGQFNFEGILDLVKFLEEVKKADMFALFRGGPF